MISLRTPGGNKLIGRVSVRTPGGDALIYDSATEGGSGGLAVAVSPPSVTGSTFSTGTPTVTTSSALAAGSGGTAPYTYGWVKTTGGDGWTINTPAGAETTFSFFPLGSGGAEFATFTVTATDARGRTATAIVDAAVFNYGSF